VVFIVYSVFYWSARGFYAYTHAAVNKHKPRVRFLYTYNMHLIAVMVVTLTNMNLLLRTCRKFRDTRTFKSYDDGGHVIRDVEIDRDRRLCESSATTAIPFTYDHIIFSRLKSFFFRDGCLKHTLGDDKPVYDIKRNECTRWERAECIYVDRITAKLFGKVSSL